MREEGEEGGREGAREDGGKFGGRGGVGECKELYTSLLRAFPLNTH